MSTFFFIILIALALLSLLFMIPIIFAKGKSGKFTDREYMGKDDKYHKKCTPLAVLSIFPCLAIGIVIYGLIEESVKESKLVPLTPKNVSEAITPVVESLQFLDAIRLMAHDFLTDGSYAHKLTSFRPSSLPETTCKGGGTIRKTITNLTAPTEVLRGSFKFKGSRVYSSCKENDVIINGAVEGEFEQLDVISRQFNSPGTMMSFSGVSIFDSKNNKEIRIDGSCKFTDIKEGSGRATLNLDISTSRTDKITSTQEAVKFEGCEIKWTSKTGTTYSVNGAVTPLALGRKIIVTTNIPIFIPENADGPKLGEMFIKAGRDKIKVVFGDRGRTLYLNNTLIK